DGQPGFRRPIGVSGQHLEVETHVVTGKASFLQNAVQCVELAGLHVEALVLEPIATAEAVTTPDERDMGVVLIDIGGGTSDIAVFVDGSIIYSSVLPVGGNHVTRDIAIGLRTPFETAEKLKIESGFAMPGMVHHTDTLEVSVAGSGERLRIQRSLLGEIIGARMSELFELSREAMLQAGVKKRLPGGIIISGGGALLPGALDLGSEIFQMPVRLGFPLDTQGWSEQVSAPQFSTGVGLCRFALQQRFAPGTQGALPALASTQGRRVWGAIAPQQLIPPPGTYADETSYSAPAYTTPTTPVKLPPDVPAPVAAAPAPSAPQPEQTMFDNMVPPSPAKSNGVVSAPTRPIVPSPVPAATPAAPNRGEDLRSEMFRREELSDDSAEKPSWWQRLLAKLREFIGFEAS
ncbi:MAG: cell division protein FtsA, partial [Alphaproteobacteria bacterium]